LVTTLRSSAGRCGSGGCATADRRGNGRKRRGHRGDECRAIARVKRTVWHAVGADSVHLFGEVRKAVRDDLVTERGGSLQRDNARFRICQAFRESHELAIGVLLGFEQGNFVVLLCELVGGVIRRVLVTAEKAAKAVATTDKAGHGGSCYRGEDKRGRTDTGACITFVFIFADCKSA